MEFIKKYWWVGLIILLLMVGSSVSTWFAKPAEVKEVEKIVYKDKIVVQEKIVKEYVKVIDEEALKRLRRTVVIIEKPDGTKISKEKFESDEATKTKTDEKAKEVVEKIVYVDREVIKTVEKTVKVQPNWNIGAGVGVNALTLLGKGELGVPGLKGAVVQVEAGRRLVGPIWLNVFANTQGTAGIGLNGTF